MSHDIKNSPAGFSSGKPRFPTSELEEISRNDGPLTAWVRLLERDGVKALATVAGDFSVGVRLDNRTLLAVDRFAIRSLCYRVIGNELRFAPRADELADVSTEVDPQAIFDYLHSHCIPSPRTIFKDIYRLPPAHYALFENGRLTVAPYWTPIFKENEKAPFDRLRDEFRALLRQAVERQMAGNDGKAGCFLSGGTDSSTVAGMIGEVGGTPAATYSIGFQAEGYDEMAYARIAARRFNTEHHEYYVTPDDLVQSIPAVAAYYDQPFGNSSALPAYYCAKMAKDDGVTRILAGDGGDELFGGNSRYAKSKVFDWYQYLPAIMRRAVMEPILDTDLAERLPIVRKAKSYVEQARVPMPDRLRMYNLIVRLGLDDVLTPQFLARVNTSLPEQARRNVWSAAQTRSNTNRELAYDWRFTLAESDLPKVCGTVHLAGIDVAFPMLDDDLLDFSMRLSADDKLKGLKLRWFFKEALRGFLPDEILTKKKQGFGLPFGVWTTRHDALRALASDSVRSLAARGILREDFVKELLDKRLYEHPGYFGEMIWISMMLEQWLRGHAASFSIKD